MSKFNKKKLLGNLCFLLSSSMRGKNFISIQDVLIFGEPFEVQWLNLSSPNYNLMAATLGQGLISPSSNVNCWVRFPFKSNYCGKIFMSIQVVLNVWEPFELQNSDIF